MGRTDLLRRVQDYAQRRGLALGEQLGSGVHGIVFAAEFQAEAVQAALKVHE